MTELTLHRYGKPGGPTLVLVHGLTEDATTWPDAVEHWGDRFDLLTVDLRGHGTSPRFTASQMGSTSRVMQDDLEALLASLPSPPVIVGHSLGGYLAARIALETPHLIRGAVLEDPAKPPQDGEETTFEQSLFRSEQLAFVDLVTAHREDEIQRMELETPWSRAEIEAWADSKARVDRSYLAEGLALAEGPWEVGLFSELSVATLVVVPAGGEMAPDVRKAANPLVERVDVEGAGHCVRRDRPEEFFAAVDAFLTRVLS